MKTLIDLTDRFPMRFDVPRMREELRELENQRWLDHYDKGLSAGWKAIPLVSKHGRMDGPESQRWGDLRDFARTPVVEKLPYFGQILDAFACPQARVRILKLMPGCGIGMHRDVAEEVACFAFHQVRLHVPIITNDRVVFHVAGQRVRMQPGRLYYVNFTRKHFVRNDGDEARIHLVLDLHVNDFLRRVFPPLGVAERVENAVVRNTLPVWWHTLALHRAAVKWAWQTYEGSWLQQARHKLRGAQAVER